MCPIYSKCISSNLHSDYYNTLIIGLKRKRKGHSLVSSLSCFIPNHTRHIVCQTYVVGSKTTRFLICYLSLSHRRLHLLSQHPLSLDPLVPLFSLKFSANASYEHDHHYVARDLEAYKDLSNIYEISSYACLFLSKKPFKGPS